jgi:hypothetical protein
LKDVQPTKERGTSNEHLSEKSFCPIQTGFLLEKQQQHRKQTHIPKMSNKLRNEMTARNEKDETILNKQKRKQTQIPSIKRPNKQQTLNENLLYFLKEFGLWNQQDFSERFVFSNDTYIIIIQGFEKPYCDSVIHNGR